MSPEKPTPLFHDRDVTRSKADPPHPHLKSFNINRGYSMLFHEYEVYFESVTGILNIFTIAKHKFA
jgi:hypothetical protein